MFEKEITFSIPEKIARSYVEDSETQTDFYDFIFRCHPSIVEEYIDLTHDLFQEYLEIGWEEP